MALPISRKYDFQANTTIVSSQVDEEFNQLISTINDLPEKDGTLQSNLNADQLDGYDASTSGGTNTIPVCVSGTIQTNLNADMVDGQHASDIAAAAFDTGTKMLFYQASPPSGWTEVSKPTDHILGWKSGQAGGTTAANSWTIDGLTVTVDGHTLTISELPSHTHSIGSHTHDITHTHELNHTHQVPQAEGVQTATIVKVSAGGSLAATGAGVSWAEATGDLTSGQPDDATTDSQSTSTSGAAVGNTSGAGNDSSHNHTASGSQDGTWRPPTAYIIIASKD